MIKNNQLEYNYYESEYCKLKIYKNDYNDIFYIYIEENKIYIQRIDKKTGWGQILKLVLFHKIIQKEEIIEAGSSEENIKIISFNENINSSLSKKPIHYENNKYKLFYISYIYNDVLLYEGNYSRYLAEESRLVNSSSKIHITIRENGDTFITSIIDISNGTTTNTNPNYFNGVEITPTIYNPFRPITISFTTDRNR